MKSQRRFQIHTYISIVSNELKLSTIGYTQPQNFDILSIMSNPKEEEPSLLMTIISLLDHANEDPQYKDAQVLFGAFITRRRERLNMERGIFAQRAEIHTDILTHIELGHVHPMDIIAYFPGIQRALDCGENGLMGALQASIDRYSSQTLE